LHHFGRRGEQATAGCRQGRRGHQRRRRLHDLQPDIASLALPFTRSWKRTPCMWVTKSKTPSAPPISSVAARRDIIRAAKNCPGRKKFPRPIRTGTEATCGVGRSDPLIISRSRLLLETARRHQLASHCDIGATMAGWSHTALSSNAIDDMEYSPDELRPGSLMSGSGAFRYSIATFFSPSARSFNANSGLRRTGVWLQHCECGPPSRGHVSSSRLVPIVRGNHLRQTT